MSIASRLNCLVFTLNSYVRNNHNVILSRKFTNTHVINVLLYNSQLKLFFLRVFISYLQSNLKTTIFMARNYKPSRVIAIIMSSKPYAIWMYICLSRNNTNQQKVTKTGLLSCCTNIWSRSYDLQFPLHSCLVGGYTSADLET